LGEGSDTAQITPKEFVDKMMEHAGDAIQLVWGTCTGVETTEVESESPGVDRKVTGVRYLPRTMEGAEGGGGGLEQNVEEQILPADCVIVSAGPWSCAVEDWFHGAIKLPMEGIKSTSIVWKQPEGVDVVDATALFCGEDNRFGTHCKCCCIVAAQGCLLQCFGTVSLKLGLQWRCIPDQTVVCIFVGSVDPTISRRKISRKAPFVRFVMPIRLEWRPPNNPFKPCQPYTKKKVNLTESKRACGRALQMPCRTWDEYPGTKGHTAIAHTTAGGSPGRRPVVKPLVNLCGTARRPAWI
jgi:hypothetical protein